MQWCVCEKMCRGAAFVPFGLNGAHASVQLYYRVTWYQREQPTWLSVANANMRKWTESLTTMLELS